MKWALFSEPLTCIVFCFLLFFSLHFAVFLSLDYSLKVLKVLDTVLDYLDVIIHGALIERNNPRNLAISVEITNAWQLHKRKEQIHNTLKTHAMSQLQGFCSYFLLHIQLHSVSFYFSNFIVQLIFASFFYCYYNYYDMKGIYYQHFCRCIAYFVQFVHSNFRNYWLKLFLNF